MKKLLIAATALLALIASASAAGKISYPADMLGVWCQVRIEDSWEYFERGKCTGTNSIVLKQNGDYIRTTLTKQGAVEERCRAIPKSYFKGWTDYVCKVGSRTVKRNQKWVTYDGEPDTLGLGGSGDVLRPDGSVEAE